MIKFPVLNFRENKKKLILMHDLSSQVICKNEEYQSLSWLVPITAGKCFIPCLLLKGLISCSSDGSSVGSRAEEESLERGCSGRLSPPTAPRKWTQSVFSSNTGVSDCATADTAAFGGVLRAPAGGVITALLLLFPDLEIWDKNRGKLFLLAC